MARRRRLDASTVLGVTVMLAVSGAAVWVIAVRLLGG